MRFNKFLEDILGNRSKIGILRFLVKTNGEFNGREIARKIGMSHQIAHKSLRDLSREQVVLMRNSGNTILYSLNNKNKFVRDKITPLFEYEASLLKNTLKVLLGKISRQIESAILYGSLSAGEGNPNSDIDLCIVLKDGKSQKQITDYFDRVNQGFSASFGNIVSPYFISRANLLEKFKRRDPHVLNIVQKGAIISGKSMSELLLNA